MRAKDKQKILKTVDKLVEYNETLKKFNGSSKYLFDKILRECNKLADEIDISDCSSEQCEALGEYKKLINSPEHDADLIKKELDVFFQQIQEENETYRVLFLPYKYSMWDSFASIFEAAKEDENCEVYVMPIPYYDKDQEGNLTEMHDESESYPDDVGIISWRGNQVDEIDPDVIFIHNPYDGNNLVTSIHPDYYTNKLVRNDRVVIYVPYYVSYTDDEGISVFMGGAEYYTDYVIVQSEWYKEKFEFEMLKHNILNDGNKFIVLGNPKYDKIRSLNKYEYPLRDDWKEKLLDASGNKKFTVLLDTTFEVLTKGRGKTLKKVEEVIGFFEKQKDFALIWRPHPLIKPTLRNMCPELIPTYVKLVDRCKNLDNCIFDDTNDMHTAMAWSDAFMGKYGSMIELYRVAKKPIIMLEVGEKTNFEINGKYDEEGLRAKVSRCQVIREKDYGLGNLIDFSMKYYRDEAEDEINQTDGKRIYDFAIKAAKIKMK
ncbi:hypothetical protein [Ligilactobacillus ruminis]|uniref:hypothetical protein n=1 Tax=Ligilactobacillus ruminis TaxID=1623 RepID=UPI00232BD8DA|nr:hypothetical protein [Ligilactobacillus ruminis]MDB7636542.1 hypothetical protein [Ligilactobacillus ruminis]MDB7679546.1 hypothetical protein [Ligilactobacillus ruminis]